MASVQFNPFVPIFENKAATTLICGQPGSGKTYFIQNLIANCIMMECNFYAVDPKNDLAVLADIFPDKIEIIDINNITSGALNPFKVLKTINTNIIASIISIICGGLTDQQTTAITPIINDFVIRFKRFKETPCLGQVSEYLYANDNEYAQAIGTKLEIHRDSAYGDLLFGSGVAEDGNGEGSVLHLEAKSLNNQKNFGSKIISLHGMDLPKKAGEMMTEEQKFNSAIVFVICKMLRELLTVGGYPTLFVMDEAHIAFQNPSFAQIMDEFMVLGRSLNVPTVLASQSINHYPKGISQMVSNKFCFKSSSNDAAEFLKMFYSSGESGDADIPSIIEQIQNFKSGTCFMIDDNQRSGIFKVTSLLGDDVTSNPLMKKRKEE